MKRAHPFLLSILVALSCVVHLHVQAENNDLPARLQVELNTFKQNIADLRGEALIGSADLLTGSGISDAGLYAVVETKTKLLIDEHIAQPKNDPVARELNAMIRTLGAMNPQARELVAGLVEGSSSRGVRERTLRLLPRLDWFVKRNFIMQKPDFYQPGQDLMTYRYLNLLTDSDKAMGRWGMEELDRRGGSEPLVYAKMRDILTQEKSSIQSPLHLDYLAWICKLLSKYDRENSMELLQSIQKDPSRDRYTKKLKKYAKV